MHIMERFFLITESSKIYQIGLLDVSGTYLEALIFKYFQMASNTEL